MGRALLETGDGSSSCRGGGGVAPIGTRTQHPTGPVAEHICGHDVRPLEGPADHSHALGRTAAGTPTKSPTKWSRLQRSAETDETRTTRTRSSEALLRPAETHETSAMQLPRWGSRVRIPSSAPEKPQVRNGLSRKRALQIPRRAAHVPHRAAHPAPRRSLCRPDRAAPRSAARPSVC
jgi:hypothetical protein